MIKDFNVIKCLKDILFADILNRVKYCILPTTCIKKSFMTEQTIPNSKYNCTSFNDLCIFSVLLLINQHLHLNSKDSKLKAMHVAKSINNIILENSIRIHERAVYLVITRTVMRKGKKEERQQQQEDGVADLCLFYIFRLDTLSVL